MDIKKIIFIILALYLGGMMIYGSLDKFTKEIPQPIEVLEKANKFSSPEQTSTLQKILYISGMKQTQYAWTVLGVAEFFLGLLIVFQRTRWIGAVLLLPITFQIFLFHLFLEADEILELFNTAVLFIINIALIFKEFPTWKSLIWLKKL